MVRVGIAEHGVLAHDVQALEFTIGSGMHDFYHGQAHFARQSFSPCFLEFLTHLGVVYFLISREHVRQSTQVASALYVVLTSQRIDTGCIAPDVSREHGKICQSQNVVRTSGVLCDAHAVDDGASFCLSKCARCIANLLRRDAGDRFGPLRCAVCHGVADTFKVLGVICDKVLVMQIFLNDDLQHCVDQGHVTAGALAHVEVGEACDLDSAWIGYDQFCIVLHDGRFDLQCDDRMGLGRVGSDDENTVSMFELGNRVGHGSAAERSRQTGNSGCVTKARTMVHVVCADRCAHEFLKEVVFFVGTFCRGKASQGVRSVILSDGGHLCGDAVQGFVPGGLFQFSVPANQRVCQPVLCADEVESEAALYTKTPVAGNVLFLAADADNAIVAYA